MIIAMKDYFHYFIYKAIACEDSNQIKQSKQQKQNNNCLTEAYSWNIAWSVEDTIWQYS